MRGKETSDKQNIKIQRAKSYFVQAAKEIILSEGVQNLSVRKIADLAGYSYTTIYNYFKDVNELLQDVKVVMINDVMDYMKGKIPDKIYDLEDIKALNRLYIQYYIERPHVYTFFYAYRLNSLKNKPADLPDYDKSYRSTYRGFVMSGIIKESDVTVVAKSFIYAIQGALALYFSDNGLMAETLYEDLDQMADYLLGEKIGISGAVR